MKKKAMSMNEWQVVGLSRYSFEGEVLVEVERTFGKSGHSGKLGVKLLPLAMTSCFLHSFKCNFRIQQAHGAERLLHGWWSLNAQCYIYSVLGVLHDWPLLLSPYLFCFPHSRFSLVLGLWMWSPPGTLLLPCCLRFSIVFSHRLNGSSLPRHTFSVRNKLGSAE